MQKLHLACLAYSAKSRIQVEEYELSPIFYFDSSDFWQLSIGMIQQLALYHPRNSQRLISQKILQCRKFLTFQTVCGYIEFDLLCR